MIKISNIRNYFIPFLGKKFGFIDEIEKLKKEIEILSWDKTFNMYNSAGLFRKCNKLPPHRIYGVAFIDLDCLHQLNNIYGYDEVNRKIKEAFHIKKGKNDIIGRIFSGDEIFIAAYGGLEELKILLKRVTQQGRKNNISFRASIRLWKTGKSNLQDLLDGMGRELLVTKQKQLRMSNKIALGA
jgi:GGDEF domain-containing protein